MSVCSGHPHTICSQPKACRRPVVSGLQRSLTSTYTTAEASTLEDFQCQICLSTLRSCVALEPCGHNFCATCLSHHFASLLQVSSLSAHSASMVGVAWWQWNCGLISMGLQTCLPCCWDCVWAQL